MNNCGISRWDDPNEINARLKALTSQPIWEVTDDYSGLQQAVSHVHGAGRRRVPL